MDGYMLYMFNSIILANYTNTTKDLYYGTAATINDNFIYAITKYNPLLLSSYILTGLFVLLSSLYFVFLIDIILKVHYGPYVNNDSTELVNATYMNDVKYVKELISAGQHIDVNIACGGSHRTVLEISVMNGYLPIIKVLLDHPHIHNSVARLEEEDINNSVHRIYIDSLIQHWHKKQSLCYAAGDGRRLDTPFESAIALLTPEELSTTRDFNGHTALSNAIQSCNLKNMNVLLAAGARLLVAADLSGTSLGTIAMKIGNIKLAHILYYKTLQAACRDRPVLKLLRSSIVVGNRVPSASRYLPREIVNYILEFIIKIELPSGF